VQIATLAVRDRMPAGYVSREMVEAGAAFPACLIDPQPARAISF